jgi:hypothetical protein
MDNNWGAVRIPILNEVSSLTFDEYKKKYNLDLNALFVVGSQWSDDPDNAFPTIAKPYYLVLNETKKLVITGNNVWLRKGAYALPNPVEAVIKLVFFTSGPGLQFKIDFPKQTVSLETIY